MIKQCHGKTKQQQNIKHTLLQDKMTMNGMAKQQQKMPRAEQSQ